MKGKFVLKGTGNKVIGTGKFVKKQEKPRGPKKRGNKYA